VLTALQKGAEGHYAVEHEQRIDEDDRDPVVLAAGGGRTFVARKDGQIEVFETKSLDKTGTFKLPGKSPPRAALVLNEGRELLVLAHDGYLHWLDVAGAKFTRPPVRGQGTISAITLDGSGHVYLAWRATRVVEYDPDGWKEVRALEPPLNMQERAFYWVIQPLYTVLPKPGELYKTVEYVLTRKTTTTLDDQNLATAQARLNPWAPVWSGLAFQAVMLALGCLYIQRQEF
jgi:hypothetical protein